MEQRITINAENTKDTISKKEAIKRLTDWLMEPIDWLSEYYSGLIEEKLNRSQTLWRPSSRLSFPPTSASWSESSICFGSDGPWKNAERLCTSNSLGQKSTRKHNVIKKRESRLWIFGFPVRLSEHFRHAFNALDEQVHLLLGVVQGK